MSTPTQPPPPVTGRPPTRGITNEIRYAVVMYGGVSLCIYINGVAQELLELARASAPGPDDSAFTPTEELSPSAKIYRRLGQYLDSDTPDARLLRQDSVADIRTRFVVDVLSGTSAGGLNSIFLAKALANNEDMEGLKKLWMEEGDIARLLNDAQSDLPGLKASSDPKSLLNSQRMYDKLLTALHAMDFPKEGKNVASAPSPLVEELDLYVTATDLRGLPIHLKLNNTVADELRHRNVFRFHYGGCANDFDWKLNPLLAFAGRCTSSIPPAFEPMRLEDIKQVLCRWPSYRGLVANAPEEWTRFHPDYRNTGETGDFWQRDFGDGGFLDNKPFTYATSALMRRQAILPVARKLLYIEPSPEPLEPDTASGREKPDALAHSLAALIGLPRYETIREDIEAVTDRNRLLERIDDLTRHVDRDVATAGAKKTIQREAGEKFENLRLTELIKRYGIAYGIYHRLKVADVTGELAALLSEHLGYPEEADERLAIRKLVEHWRNRWYAEDPPQHSPTAGGNLAATQTKFLLDFDLGYRLRRLFFLHRKITYFYRFAPGSPETMERQRTRERGLPDPLPPEIAEIVDQADQPERLHRFRAALLDIKRALAGVLHELRQARRELRKDKQLETLVAATKLTSDALEKCLRNPEYAEELVATAEASGALKEIAERIAAIHKDAFIKASDTCLLVLSGISTPRNAEEMIAQQTLRGFFDHFDHYDMAIFPIQYGTGSSETPHIDILRVSPRDARNLCEDNGERRKLAGTEFFAFGAFFADFWRENDMLWGRLDGAEILVRNLLEKTRAARDLAAGDPAFRDHPGLKTERDRAEKTIADLVIDDLHTAILRAHLTAQQRADVWAMLQKTLPHLRRDNLHREVDLFLNNAAHLDRATRRLISFCQDDKELLSYYKTTYAVDRRLDRGPLLQVVGRATQIFGRMLEGISASHGKRGQDQAALLTRVASIFSGLVELSLPRTAGQILWRYWRSLLYAIGLLLFFLGLLFGEEAVQKGGLLIFLVTAAIHIATTTLELWILRWGPLWRAAAAILSLFLAALFLLGAWKATELPALIGDWWKDPATAVTNTTAGFKTHR